MNIYHKLTRIVIETNALDRIWVNKYNCAISNRERISYNSDKMAVIGQNICMRKEILTR